MNPLEQYPHLFANGKFWYRHPHLTDKQVLRGYDIDEIVLDKSTLIARPISDITDEEMAERMELSLPLDYGFGDAYKNSAIKDANNNKLLAEFFLYLLSIGVYPFDQSHFETGEVIKAEQS